MDFRPIDTTTTITTRNHIRVNALVNLCLVVVYLSIEPYVAGAHMSWIHQFHILLQPLVLFVSVSDSSIITKTAIFLCVAACLFDSCIVWLNYISLTRCLDEPTSACVETSWEKGVWFILGAGILINDVLATLRLWTLQKVLDIKDLHEEANKDHHEALSIKPAPTLRTLQVHCAKMRVIHVFLIPAGIVYSVFMIPKAFADPVYFATLGHLLLDLYGTSVSKIHDKWSLIVLGLFLGLFAIINIVQLLMDFTKHRTTILEELAYLISVLYIFADSLLLFFTVSNVSLLQEYAKNVPKKDI